MKGILSTVESASIPDSVDRARVFCHPRIPDDLLQTAKSRFAPIAEDETPLILAGAHAAGRAGHRPPGLLPHTFAVASLLRSVAAVRT